MTAELKKYTCKTCGGNLLPADNGGWKCPYCASLWYDETVKRDEEEILRIVGDYNEAQKVELIANIRRNLYDAVNEKYTDSQKILSLCARLKEYLPGDFMANFYEVANGNDIGRIVGFINMIDVELYREYLDGILAFLIKSFTAALHLPLVNLIEKAYRKTDLEKFEHYSTKIAEEAEKENNGVYQTSLTRDVFVAYSSRDMDKVYSLVTYLEASGLKCFVAARNLRHGRGAVQNYKNAIAEAIRSCKSVVFVSSQASRNFSCDALSFELPLIKDTDIQNAPAEFKQNYSAMPSIYKKPRVEYRLEESLFPNAADLQVKEFFDGCEFAYTPQEVGQRVIKLLNEAESKKAEIDRNEVSNPVKYDEVDSLLDNANVHLEFGEFEKAKKDSEKIIEKYPRNAMAYVCALMAELRVKKQSELILQERPFDNNINYQKILKFGDANLKNEFIEYTETIKERIRMKALEAQYAEALNKLNAADNEEQYLAVKAVLEQLKDYKDASTLAANAGARVEEIRLARLENAYSYALKLYNTASSSVQYLKAADEFDRVPKYKDAAEMSKKAREQASLCAAREKAEREQRLREEEERRASIYGQAKALMKKKTLISVQEAKKLYSNILNYSDAKEMVQQCDELIDQIKERKATAKARVRRNIVRVIYLIITVFFVRSILGLNVNKVFDWGKSLDEGSYGYVYPVIILMGIYLAYSVLTFILNKIAKARISAYIHVFLGIFLCEYSIIYSYIVYRADSIFTDIGIPFVVVLLLGYGISVGFGNVEKTESKRKVLSVLLCLVLIALSVWYAYYYFAIVPKKMEEAIILENKRKEEAILLENQRIEGEYTTAMFLMADGSFSAAKEQLSTLNGYKDSLKLIDECDAVIKGVFKEFIKKYNITEYTIPKGVTSIGYSAFNGCENLKSITIPNSVTIIGNHAFANCSKLVSITIPDSVKRIGTNTFQNCNTLESIAIPDSVTSIADRTFHGCTNLKSVTIPNSVKSIGIYAFDMCEKLTNISFLGTKEEWADVSKGLRWNNTCPTITVTCTDGTITEQ